MHSGAQMVGQTLSSGDRNQPPAIPILAAPSVRMAANAVLYCAGPSANRIVSAD
jgi:hypothetical protein